jgi:hypothetical protein
MEFLEFLRNRGVGSLVNEELIYEFIAAELAEGAVRKGLWTKALADAEWEEGRAKALYVKMRYEQIHRELQNRPEGRDPIEPARLFARRRALDRGLTSEEIDYLDLPIEAVKYLKKYRVSQDALFAACAIKRLTSVMSNGVLWVADRPIAKS